MKNEEENKNKYNNNKNSKTKIYNKQQNEMTVGMS